MQCARNTTHDLRNYKSGRIQPVKFQVNCHSSLPNRSSKPSRQHPTHSQPIEHPQAAPLVQRNEDEWNGGIFGFGVPSDQLPTTKAPDRVYVSDTDREFITKLLRRVDERVTPNPFRIFKYGLDDYRLYCAMYESRMLGRIVVVDSMEGADAILIPRKKRTGKGVDPLVMENAARNANVPLIILPAVSGIRLMERLSPLMGIPIPEHLLCTPSRKPVLPSPKKDGSAAMLSVLSSIENGALGMRPSQQEARWEGSEGSSSIASDVNDSADVIIKEGRDNRPGGRRVIGGLWAGREVEPLDFKLGMDSEQSCAHRLPRNPCDWVGTKYTLNKPIKHGARIAKMRQKKRLEDFENPW